MNHHKPVLLYCLLLILTSVATRAQSKFAGYSNQSITLRSDFPPKSVLISNLIADRAGDMSPVIGAARWTDSGRQLECRSLLVFDYGFLPKMISDDPSQINSAELILFPLQVAFSSTDKGKQGSIMVRRVVEAWEDTTTMWIQQPGVDSIKQVSKLFKNKNKPVSVDVTGLVRDMLRFGNNGFMISYPNEQDESIAFGQLFASPKHDDEELHPLLIINYGQRQMPVWPVQPVSKQTDVQRQMDLWIRSRLDERPSQRVTAPTKAIPTKEGVN